MRKLIYAVSIPVRVNGRARTMLLEVVPSEEADPQIKGKFVIERAISDYDYVFDATGKLRVFDNKNDAIAWIKAEVAKHLPKKESQNGAEASPDHAHRDRGQSGPLRPR